MKEHIQIKGGIYFRWIDIPKGMTIPQHVHLADHATMVVFGKARLWVQGIDNGTYEAGEIIEIQGGKHHSFQALQDSRLTCIWPESVADEFEKKFPVAEEY